MAHEEGSELDQDLVGGVPASEEIEIAVKDALLWDERVDAEKIQVGACGGAIMLAGEVRTPEERQLAEQIAWRVRGVTDVANELKVAAAKPRS